MHSEPNYSAAAGYIPKVAADAAYGRDTLAGGQISRSSGEGDRCINELALHLERASTLLGKLNERLHPVLADIPVGVATSPEKRAPALSPLASQLTVLGNQARDLGDIASAIHERLSL